MAIIVNGVNIPTNGDFIKVGNNIVDKVVCNGITVWEKAISQPPISITPENITDYLDIVTVGQPGDIGVSMCGSYYDDDDYDGTPYNESHDLLHDDRHVGWPMFLNGIMYCFEPCAPQIRTWIVTPKAPYTKIRARFHGNGIHNAIYDKGTGVTVNGINVYWTYVTLEAPRFEIVSTVETEGWAEHWRTDADCCMYDIILT